MAATTCPYCGKVTSPNVDHCPHCGGPLRGRSGEKTPEQAAPAGRCPNCGQVVQEGDIICVSCGTNLLTGQKVADERREVLRAEKASIWPVIAGVLGVVVVVGLVAALLLWLAHDPVGEAERLSAQGNVIQALNVLEPYAAENPEEADAQLLLGKLYWRSQQYDEALEAFEAAAERAPENEEAPLYALVAASQLTSESAFEQQVRALEQLVQAQPDNAEAWFLLGLAKGAQGEYEEQIEALQEALTLAPSDTARRYVGVGEALQGDLTAAEAALAGADTSGDTLAARALVAGIQGEDPRAQDLLQSAVEAETSIPAYAQTQLGLLYLSQGRYEEALAQLRDAKALPDAPAAAQFFHALALAELGLQDDALQSLEEIIVSEENPFAGRAALQSAIIQLESGNTDGALDSANQAMQMGVEPARVQTVRGRVYKARQDFAQASQALAQAQSNDPSYAPAYLESGLLYVQQGFITQGARALEQYLELAREQNLDDSRLNEVAVLVDQLRESAAQDSATASRPGA